MEQQTPIAFTLSNIPIINLRKEFDAHFRLLGSEKFLIQLYDYSIPVELPSFKWTGLPDNLLTLMLQRAILGVESYLGAAVEYELTEQQCLTDEIKEKLNNPFRLGGRGTADNFYNKLPGLVSDSYQLSKSDSQLYKKIREFYKLFRNPLFHGYQLSGATPAQMICAFELIRSIYIWIDRWYSAFRDSGFGGDFSN